MWKFGKNVNRDEKVSRLSDDPVDRRYCLQLNNDEMLFFSDKSELDRYISDYSKINAIFNCSAFCVKFYPINID